MSLILIPLGLYGIVALFNRVRIARLDGTEFQPELTETFLRWKSLKLRRLDVFIAGVVILFGGLVLLASSDFSDALAPLAPVMGMTFWTCLIYGYVLHRKAARLESILNSDRRPQ